MKEKNYALFSNISYIEILIPVKLKLDFLTYIYVGIIKRDKYEICRKMVYISL